LALVAVVVVPRVTNIFRTNVQSSVRRFGALVKYAYDQAILTRRVHRIVLDLDKQAWRVEVAPPGEIFLSGQFEREYDYKFDAEKLKSEISFGKIKGSLVDKMPSGVRIVRVEQKRFSSQQDDKEKGEHFIIAFPGGYIEEATIYLAETSKKSTQEFKVEIQSLTGKIKTEIIDTGPRQ
jgi:hypothetical protein